MLKKVLFTFLIAVVSLNAMAAEDKPLDFKLLSVEEKHPDNDKNIKIVAKDLKGGVFIQVRGGWSTTYPKTAKLISDLFAKQGIKVTDDPAAADYGIQFMSAYGFDYGDIETQAASGGLNAGQVGAIIGGGVFALIGVMSSSGTDKPVKAVMSCFEVDKPSLNSRGNVLGENQTSVISTVEYQTNKKGIETSNALFAAYMGDFIKNHFVLENATPDETTTPAASSVSAAPVVLNTK